MTVERLRRQIVELQEKNGELREEVRFHEAKRLQQWDGRGGGGHPPSGHPPSGHPSSGHPPAAAPAAAANPPPAARAVRVERAERNPSQPAHPPSRVSFRPSDVLLEPLSAGRVSHCDLVTCCRLYQINYQDSVLYRRAGLSRGSRT